MSVCSMEACTGLVCPVKSMSLLSWNIYHEDILAFFRPRFRFCITCINCHCKWLLTDSLGHLGSLACMQIKLREVKKQVLISPKTKKKEENRKVTAKPCTIQAHPQSDQCQDFRAPNPPFSRHYTNIF